MTISEIAEQIATKAHDGQFRRDGVTPYVTHPRRVAKRVSGNEDAEAVAWLHDVLEDTSETEESLLAAGIPQHVVDAVRLLTKEEGVVYEDYLARLNKNELARAVKIQDMLDNLSDGPREKQIKKYAKGLLILHGEEP
jgi:(p)ppGpp synthase/HD superfamily hydrolase